MTDDRKREMQIKSQQISTFIIIIRVQQHQQQQHEADSFGQVNKRERCTGYCGGKVETTAGGNKFQGFAITSRTLVSHCYFTERIREFTQNFSIGVIHSEPFFY